MIIVKKKLEFLEQKYNHETILTQFLMFPGMDSFDQNGDLWEPIENMSPPSLLERGDTDL